MKNFEILVNTDLSDETIEFISDCWLQFVTCELNLNPSDLLMITPDMSTEKTKNVKCFQNETNYKIPMSIFWKLIDYFSGQTQNATDIIDFLETKTRAIGARLEYLSKFTS